MIELISLTDGLVDKLVSFILLLEFSTFGGDVVVHQLNED